MLTAKRTPLLPQPTDGSANEQLPILEQGHPVLITRMYADYYEAEVYGMDGTRY